jgi:hypothetical protein
MSLRKEFFSCLAVFLVFFPLHNEWRAFGQVAGTTEPALPGCSGTLPRSKPCTLEKDCAAPVDNTCSTWIKNLLPVDTCSGDGAAEGDHCFTTSARTGCAQKGLCSLQRRPNKDPICVQGVGTNSVWKYVAVLGGDCVVGPAPTPIE